MKRRLILWLNLSAWFLLLGGIIFDQILSANWKSGKIEDIDNMKAFYHVTNPGYYFIPVKFPVLIFSIVSLISFWKISKTVRLLLMIVTTTIITDLTFSAYHFDPIIMYTSGSNIDPIIAQQKATSFYTFNFLRILLDLFGVCIAALALHKSYLRKSDL
ncbi:MAG: hypothetical protein U0X91_01870 [Spirosomataceae bacterium]